MSKKNQEKNKEFRKATLVDLNKLSAEKGEALRIFRFGASGSKVKNLKEGVALRKDIARIKTELRARTTAK